MYKRITASILCICLIITACSDKNTNPVDQPAEKTDIQYDENKFDLTAIKSDNQGIDNSSGFQLTSRENISKNFIKDNLQLIPEKEFKIEEVSKTIYNIIPSTELENNKIYQAKLMDGPFEYSWAFQTKKEFKIENTIPSDGSSYVPVNSGIEIYFSLKDFEDIDNYFEIEPKAEGRFIYKDNCVIFAPESLEHNTRYTVTVKKGYGLKGGTERLKEDYTFSFITERNSDAEIYFDNPLINISENNAKLVGAYIGNQYTEAEFTINIYQYKTDDEFAKDVRLYAETGKFPEDIKNTNNLVSINSIKQKPFIDERYSYRNKAIFELPDDMKKGYYLLELSAEGFVENSYLFMQINDMLVYNAIFEEQVLVFAGETVSGNGIQDANIILNDKNIGVTDENGTLISRKKADDYETVFLRVAAKGYNDFIYADSALFQNYYYRNLSEASESFRYIDTDRPVYMNTDTVNVWGFARYRDENTVNKVKINLVESGTELILDSKQVELTDIGTYTAQFNLNNTASGSLRVEVYDNDIKLSTKYIEVRKYTKPLYTMSGELSKKVMYRGDELIYKVNAGFFDGSPVPNFKIMFNTHTYGSFAYGSVVYEDMDNEITLNENGEAEVKINTEAKSSSWRPVNIDLYCYNKEAENTSVSLWDNFKVFPKNKMLEVNIDYENPAAVDILLHELVIEDYSTDQTGDYSELRGKPLDDTVNVRIIEGYYEKIKIKELYDYVNKVNNTIYDYRLVENTVYHEDVNISSGIAGIEIPNYDENRSYRIIASCYDEVNENIEEEAYIHGRYIPYERLYYSLEKADTKESYRSGDAVNMEVSYNNETAVSTDNDNLLLMFARNGLIDCKFFDGTNIQYDFDEAFIPNVSIQGAYIKNGYMYPVTGFIYYDRTERQIYFDAVTDKENYKPGEEVTLNIKAYDENKNPCAADVNVSVVDEAYFALFEKYVRTLDDLYTYSFHTGLIKEYLSNMDINTSGSGGAEKGGGGGNDNAFRDDFEDTAMFRTVTTDKSGKAALKFKLPDNLTSWRITYQAISDKLYAGSGTKNITVSLPFFVDLIMGREYLKDDNINAALRVFGTDTVKSEEVDYKITVENKETGKKTDFEQKGITGSYTNVLLGKLNEGNYEIYVTASSKNNKDAIKEEFNVADSYVYFNNTDYYKITEDTVLEEVYSNPVITLLNESSSDFYNSLDAISSSYGRRLDQTVCSMIAGKYINEYFKTNLEFDEEDLISKITEYESENERGYKLFPYSSADMEVTAKLSYLTDDESLNSKFRYYFKYYVENNAEYNTNIAASLWGLSNYKEPVLLTIYDLLENHPSELGVRDKLYLSLALAELGDNKKANKYYRELTSSLIKSGDYLYYDNNQNSTDNYELTALLAVLGVKLNDFETGDKMFRYIYNKPSNETLSNFEQLIYIMNRDIMKLDEIKDLFGEVTVTTDGTGKTYKLKLFDRESFAVPKEKIKDIKFSKINGSIACKVDASGNKDDLDKHRTDDISIKISYVQRDKSTEQTNYNQSDIVKVEIMPGFASEIEYGQYEITYVIPSGFRYIEAGPDTYRSDIDGQKLKFDYFYNKHSAIAPIVFYMQAAQKGEYTVDYAVIKEAFEANLNYVDKSVLTIN